MTDKTTPALFFLYFSSLLLPESAAPVSLMSVEIFRTGLFDMTEGQIEDWDNFVETHAKRIFRVAHRILGSNQDAEDVSQDVFIEAFEARIKGTVRNWVGFLVRITISRSIDRYRKTKPSVTITEHDAVSNVQPIDLLIEEEQKRSLRRKVSQLPNQQATVFVMHYYEHMTHEEIATELDITVESVASALYKARKQLASRMMALTRGEAR